MLDLKKFFSTPERPVTNGEMMDYWKSLTEDEKKAHKELDLS